MSTLKESDIEDATMSHRTAIERLSFDDAGIITTTDRHLFQRSALPFLITTSRFTGELGTYGYIDTIGLKPHDLEFRHTATLFSIAYCHPAVTESFSSVSKFTGTVFTNWLSRLISQRFGLPMEDKLQLDILFAIYYLLDGDAISEVLKDERKAAKFLANVAEVATTTLPAVMRVLSLTTKSHTVLAELVSPLDIDLLPAFVKAVSPALDTMVNENTISAMVTSSWYGDHASYYCIAALTSRPIFVAMVYTAINSPVYKRSGLTKLINEFAEGRRKDKSERFTASVDGIYRGLINKK